jgi:hypothetical protein
VFCACGAIFSNISHLNTKTNVWKCEFCNNDNTEIALEPQEIPQNKSVDYLIEPGEESDDGKLEDRGLVCFVIDISGSMCVTTEVEELMGEQKHNVVFIVIVMISSHSNLE